MAYNPPQGSAEKKLAKEVSQLKETLTSMDVKHKKDLWENTVNMERLERLLGTSAISSQKLSQEKDTAEDRATVFRMLLMKRD